MTTEITNSDDLIDIRDVIERYEELESERESLTEARDEFTEPSDQLDAAVATLAEWQTDYGDELHTLGALLDELKGDGGDEQWKGDWYPGTLIRDSYFVDAMQELVTDIGDLPRDIPSYLAIDWEKTAENLQVDYSSVEFDGVTYWYR